MKYHEKPAHFRELFSNLLPILLALFIWTNPVLAQNNGELITLSLKNKTIGEALETINKRYIKNKLKNTFYNRVVLNISKSQYQLQERLPSPHK